ncbi:MAG: SLC13 family permease [Candidatus Heimdallarchaeaceae archaeon]
MIHIWVARALIILIVLGTIVLLMIQGIDATKVTVTGAILAALVLRYFTDWKSVLEANSSEHVPEHFLNAISAMVNVEAILIIFSVSLIVTITKEKGFFTFISLYIVKLTKGNPRLLLISLGALSFLTSMFFDNLSAIILLGSLTVIVCKQIDLDPIPYVLFVGMNTIIGGLPTPVSSLPNIIFVSYYKESISFIEFMAYMLPIALLFFLLSTGFFMLVYRKQIFIEVPEEKTEQLMRINPWSAVEKKSDIIKSIILVVVLFGGFLMSSYIHLNVALVALIAAIFGLFLFKSNLKKFLHEGVEWEMIVFFIALFVLMGVLSGSGSLSPITNLLGSLLGEDRSKSSQILVAIIIGAIGLPITGFLNGSSAALIFAYIFNTLGQVSRGLWIGFVLSGNIGGSLTPLGSITILMALEILNREGNKITFAQYIKQTITLTLLFGVLSIVYSIILIEIFPL